MPQTTSPRAAIAAAWSSLLRQFDVGNVPSSKTLRQTMPSSETWTNQHRRWRPQGYYRLFCAHDRALWETCASATCKRGSGEAKRNLQKLMSGEL